MLTQHLAQATEVPGQQEGRSANPGGCIQSIVRGLVYLRARACWPTRNAQDVAECSSGACHEPVTFSFALSNNVQSTCLFDFRVRIRLAQLTNRQKPCRNRALYLVWTVNVSTPESVLGGGCYKNVFFLHVKMIALVHFCTAPSGAPCHNPECHLRARLDKREVNSERVMLFGPPGVRPGPTELALGAIESQRVIEKESPCHPLKSQSTKFWW